jgi:hypothetical protein
MTNQQPQKPVVSEKKQAPQHKPDQHGKDKKDHKQSARSGHAKRVK